MTSMPISSDLDLEMTEKPNSIFTIERKDDDVLKTGSLKDSSDCVISDDVQRTSREVIENIRMGIIND